MIKMYYSSLTLLLFYIFYRVFKERKWNKYKYKNNILYLFNVYLRLYV
jgi:hypothetical protein